MFEVSGHARDANGQPIEGADASMFGNASPLGFYE
jgi:hypothetical protein